MTDGSPEIAEKFLTSFKQKCVRLVESGYDEMSSENDFESDWEEEEFTRTLYLYMREEVRSPQYSFMDVDLENYDISEATGQLSRIDFKIREVTRADQVYAYLECKLLENEASSYYSYRKEGVLRFVSGKYAPRPEHDIGFMVGYVVSSQMEEIIDELTELVDSDSDLEVDSPMTPEKEGKDRFVYESEHLRKQSLGPLTVTHIFLDYS